MRGRSRRRRKNRIPRIFLFFYSILLLLGIAYVVYSQRFHGRFFPNTYVNGIDASGKTVERVKKEIEELTRSYVLQIKSRGNGEERLRAEDIGLGYILDESLERYVGEQNVYLWIQNLRGRTDIKISTMTGLDERRFSSALSSLHAFDPALMKAPRDAVVSDYIPGVGYRITPEEEGTILDIEKAREQIRRAVLTLEREIDLSDPSYDLYQKPAILRDDPRLKSKVELLNRYIAASIGYDKDIVLDKERIHQWISPNQPENNMIDYTQIEDFVAELSKSYNTVYRPKNFQTHEGVQITVTGGNYGWKVNQIAEAAAIRSMVAEGKVIEGRKPEFSRKAAAFGENDYGNTYAEVNLSRQKLYFYKDGTLLLESDIVSGDEAKGFLTPAGVYQIAYKQENAVLKGEDYNASVAKWLPFNGNIGFHDAAWRDAFGGEIYKREGSHGCINLPPEMAGILYENIDTGTPVICYYEDGKTPKNVNAEPGTVREGEPAQEAVQENRVAESITAPSLTASEAPPEPSDEQKTAQKEKQSSDKKKKKKRRRTKSGGNASAQNDSAKSTSAQSTTAAETEPGTSSPPQETIPSRNPPIRVNQNGPGMESQKAGSAGPATEGGTSRKEEKGPGIDMSLGSPPPVNGE